MFPDHVEDHSEATIFENIRSFFAFEVGKLSPTTLRTFLKLRSSEIFVVFFAFEAGKSSFVAPHHVEDLPAATIEIFYNLARFPVPSTRRKNLLKSTADPSDGTKPGFGFECFETFRLFQK